MEVKIFRCDTEVISETKWEIRFRRDVYTISDENFSLVAEAIKMKTGGAFVVTLDGSKITIEQISETIPKGCSLNSLNTVKEEVLGELTAACELLLSYDSRHFYEKYCKPAESTES